MVFLFGTIRMAATIAAVVAGAQAWPLWALGGAILVHALAAYAAGRAALAYVQDQLASEADVSDEAVRAASLVPPPILREFAYAFVRCGIAYFVGFWLFQLAETPT